MAPENWVCRKSTSAGVYDNLGTTAYSIPRGRTSQSFQILDNFTAMVGRHTIKFGGEFRRAIVNSYNDNLERGIFSFSAADPSTLTRNARPPRDAATRAC